MAGLSQAEQVATLDARFSSGDYVAYSANGSSEFAGLTRSAITWANATNATPSVKANSAAIVSNAATAAGTVSHFAVFSAASAGTQRTDWQALGTPRTLAIGDKVEWASGSLVITLD